MPIFIVASSKRILGHNIFVNNCNNAVTKVLHGSFDTASLQLLHVNSGQWPGNLLHWYCLPLNKDHLLKDHFLNHRGGRTTV